MTKLFFFLSISSYYIKLPDHTNHATDLKSSLKRFLGKEKKIDATLQNFIYKHTIDLENIQKNKKKEEFTCCQGSSN